MNERLIRILQCIVNRTGDSELDLAMREEAGALLAALKHPPKATFDPLAFAEKLQRIGQAVTE
jgi:hypothetical protein